MAVAFPTSPGRTPTGQPLVAKPCRCADRRMPDDFTCTRCGFFDEATIRETWAEAAKRAARSQAMAA